MRNHVQTVVVGETGVTSTSAVDREKREFAVDSAASRHILSRLINYKRT